RVLVAELAEQELGDVDLAGGNRPQHVRMLDQRAVGMHCDLELTTGRALDVLHEALDVEGVKLSFAVWRGHVPLGLRMSGRGERGRKSAPQEITKTHVCFPIDDR